MKMLYVVAVVTLAAVTSGFPAETKAWMNDYTVFRTQMEKGDAIAAAGAEEVMVTWEAVYRGIKADPKAKSGAVQIVQLDLEPLVTPQGKVDLKFICEKADAEKWKSVKDGARVRFTAQWTRFITASSKQPKSTLFYNAQLKDVLPSEAAAKTTSK